MSQTDPRESAFLKDLYLNELWTSRFTDLLDKSLKADEAPESIVYFNAGTGNHVFALRELFGKDSPITAVCEDEETLKIAVGKAEAMRSDVTFTCSDCEGEVFDLVILDASLLSPSELNSSLERAVAACKSGGSVAVMSATAGSFGEVFSVLWEHCFATGDTDGGELVERLIGEIPTSSALEDSAKSAGLEKVVTKVSNEIFEMGEGEDLSSSILLNKFLFPRWLTSSSEGEISETATALANLIKDDDPGLSFRFSVKATLLTGIKK